MHVKEDTESWTKTYVIATELLIETHLPQVSRSTRATGTWKMLFSPVEFCEDNPDMSMTTENQALPMHKLKQYGKQLTLAREKIR